MKTLGMLLVVTVLLNFSRGPFVIPPGTVKIENEWYADITEVTNLSWAEYLLDLKHRYGTHSSQFLSALPDTMVWAKIIPSLVSYYHRHPAYKNYPVVGVSYEQALAFCKWRTEHVKAMFRIRHKTNWNIEYTLPTPSQWEQMAYWEAGKVQTNTLETTNFNCAETRRNAHTIMVNLFKKSITGQYQLLGNVAEMTSEKGIAKGGSWFHDNESCRVGQFQLYTQPTAWLGLRCVCIVKPQ